MTTEAIVFSPHLDDGALSASSRLMQPAARLVTVLSGAPPDGLELTTWGRLTRAASMAQRHAERLAEDHRAVEILGCATERLDEPEEEFRDGPLDLAALSARLEPMVEQAGQVWAPSAVGGNRDHRAVRDAVLAACRSIGRDSDLFLFADVPYSLRYGWPAWVTGYQEQTDHLDAAFWLDNELARCGLEPARLEPDVVALSARARARKDQAVRAYATQLPALGLSPADPLRWASALSHEVVWRLTP